MSEQKVYPVPASFAASTLADKATYERMYHASVTQPETFWAEMAEDMLSWDKRWDKVAEWDYNKPEIKWFQGAKLNASYNCIDRHLAENGDKTAIIWEADDPATPARHISYNELQREVCRFANVLKKQGVKKGDRVCISMPMIPEAAYAMLACARIGAIHSVVFGGFSAEALKGRIVDADAHVVVTADEGRRGGKKIPLKKTVDDALKGSEHNVRSVVVVKHTGEKTGWVDGRDHWYHDLVAEVDDDCLPESMAATDPLFILYTSGSTGKPKGVVHGTGGYLLYAATTFKYVFDHQDNDIFWCSADVGWITGHSYLVYGPLANGATTVMFEGVPNYPDYDRFWQVVDKHKVTLFYTAPTAIRALHAHGDEYVTRTSRESLRLLGTVGEPINPEAWEWYYRVIGEQRCPIVDTWWQTETGGILLTPLPGAMDLKPGSVARPFFGVQPVVVDESGQELTGEAEGFLCLNASWPGQMMTVWGDHERFKQTYFSRFEGRYFSGDGCRRDADGYYRITGRVDDVLNVSGHRLGTAEVESALVLHPQVAEAAVVGVPHSIKGEGIYAYVTLNAGVDAQESLKAELVALVRSEIGPIASPDAIQWAPGLPKTRSGKIMRRILRKVAAGDTDNLGDTSTLADPEVVATLIDGRVNLQAA